MSPSQTRRVGVTFVCTLLLLSEAEPGWAQTVCRRLTCPSGNLIRFQFGPPSASTITRNADAQACGFELDGITSFHDYCPGDPYVGSGPSLCPDKGTSWASFCQATEPFAAFYANDQPAGQLSFSVPSGFNNVRLRADDAFAEDVRPIRTPAAAVFRNTTQIWNQTQCRPCPTTMSFPVEPGDNITLREHFIFLVYWIELRQLSSANTTTEFVEDCAPAPLACPTNAPTPSLSPTPEPPTAPTALPTMSPTATPSTAQPTSRPTAFSPLCKHQACSGGNLIRFQFGPPSASTITRNADAQACGFELDGITSFHDYCPGDPYVGSGPSLCPDKGTSWASFCQATEPFAAFYADGQPAGQLSFSVPSGFNNVRLRADDAFAEDVRPIRTPAAAVFRNTTQIWNQTQCRPCPTTMSFPVEPGDNITLREHFIFLVYWIELRQLSSANTTTEFVEDCAPAPLACPTSAPTATLTASPTALPTLLPTTLPSPQPTALRTALPTQVPSVSPMASPTEPFRLPAASPTVSPTVSPTSSSGGGSSLALIIGISLAVLMVAAVAMLLRLRSAGMKETLSAGGPTSTQSTAMFSNPIHQAALTPDYLEPQTVFAERIDSRNTDYLEPRALALGHVRLDPELYVQNTGRNDSTVGVYEDLDDVEGQSRYVVVGAGTIATA